MEKYIKILPEMIIIQTENGLYEAELTKYEQDFGKAPELFEGNRVLMYVQGNHVGFIKITPLQ